MTLMRVLAKDGFVLTYDSNDVEHVEVSTLHDVAESEGSNGTVWRELTGTAHLHLSIDFKPGTSATWIKDEIAP
jgi:hypothetical protein